MKVDLSNFFKDERRHSLVFIDAAWKNIKDLQDHIQNLFSLEDISLLTTDGCFLPPRESIKVLKSAEGLKAFRFVSRDNNTFVSPAPVKCSKKRKNRSADEQVHLSASTPLRPSKRSKNQSNTEWLEIAAEPSCVKIDELDDEAPGPSMSLKNKDATKAPNMSVKIEAENKESVPQTQKRSMRKKRPKSPGGTDQEEDDPAPLSISRYSVKEGKMSEGKKQKKVPDTLSEKSAMVTLQEDKTPEEQQEMPAKLSQLKAVDQIEKGLGISTSLPSISFRSPLLEMSDNVPRIFQFSTRKNKVEILENIKLAPINAGFLPQKKAKGDDTAKQSPSDGKDSILEFESETVRDQESPNVQNKETVSANATFSEDIIETSTLPVSTTGVEFACLDNATETETTLPSEADATNPLEFTDSELHLEEASQSEKIMPHDANASSIKIEVDSKDVKPPPVRNCAEQLISDSDDDVMVVDDSNMDVSDSDSDIEPVPVVEDRRYLDMIKDLMRNATPLTGLPTRGDTILFKLLKIKGNANSGTTEFISGNCTYVNRRTKIFTVEPETYPPEIGRIMSQYYKSGLDESSEDVRTLSIHLQDMNEAKIVVATID
ncbi:coilin isoform X2 [Drosophila erecta]|nr:coilin isoform X2 [Drosophila erecta]